MSVKLNRRQKAFADNIIKGKSAISSALDAGYSENYANAKSYMLLEHEGIREYINKRTHKIVKKQEEKTIAEQEDVLKSLSKIVLDGYEQTYSRRRVKRMTIDEDGNPMEIEEEIRNPYPADVVRASEALAKILGMTGEDNNITDQRVTIINDLPKEE